MGDMSGTTTVREIERKYESDGPLDAGLVAELATAIAGAPDRDAPTPREPTPLGPVVELDAVRREWTLTDAKGNTVATDDRVTGHTLGAETGATSWAEIEVELAGQGTLDVLDRIEAVLGRTGVHRSASASKLGRVLADRIPPGAGAA